MTKGLSPTCVFVMEGLARGLSLEEIMGLRSGLSQMHIRSAAQEVLLLNENMSRVEYNVAKIRVDFPNAYKSWTPSEQSALIAMVNSGLNLEQLCSKFGRQPSAILSRVATVMGRERAEQLGPQ